MGKTSIIFIFILLVIAVVAVGFLIPKNKMPTENQTANLNLKEKIRHAAVAGQFYPAEKDQLEKMIDDFLDQAKPAEIEGEIFGLLLPHAGYVFSGPVAAYGAKVISNKNYDTVIIIGDSHYERFDGVAIWPNGAWETPLGKVEVDSELAQKILKESDRFFVKDSAHLFEHSLEVEIPFLQKVLKNFKILPITFGSENKDWKNLAQAILKNIKGKKVLIIASSDLSHYPSYKEAQKADLETLNAILKADPKILEDKIKELEEKGIPNTQTFLCSQDAVKTLLEIARNLNLKAKLLKYANSGDSPAGNKTQVVGYGAVAFYKENNQNLSEAEKKELLSIAKKSVEDFIKTGEIPDFEVKSEKLKNKQGAFVTLKENGELRGCIGHLADDEPLYKVVSQMAVAAATQDHRFLPVSKEELDKLEYEISVLTPLKKINSVEEIKIGKDGVLAKRGIYSGVFLPQVATENNWDLETFLNHLMIKAGLPANYWKEEPVEFYVFEAEVFSEDSKRI